MDRKKGNEMKTNTIIAVILIIVGIMVFLYQGILFQIVGIFALVGGILLFLVIGRKEEDLITGKAPMILIGTRFKKSYINNI